MGNPACCFPVEATANPYTGLLAFNAALRVPSSK